MCFSHGFPRLIKSDGPTGQHGASGRSVHHPALIVWCVSHKDAFPGRRVHLASALRRDVNIRWASKDAEVRQVNRFAG